MSLQKMKWIIQVVCNDFWLKDKIPQQTVCVLPFGLVWIAKRSLILAKVAEYAVRLKSLVSQPRVPGLSLYSCSKVIGCFGNHLDKFVSEDYSSSSRIPQPLVSLDLRILLLCQAQISAPAWSLYTKQLFGTA